MAGEEHEHAQPAEESQGPALGSAVCARELTKRYGRIDALCGVSLDISRGELFGMLGPNGAGKSTVIKILATLTRPSSGEAWVDGCHVLHQQAGVRRAIGIVFQDPSLDEKLTARENLDFHARMYGLDGPTRRHRMGELLELVGLTARADSLVETYSGGMKRRLEIARGLMHRPRVLFLDEPTLGLDAQTRRHIWDYIRDLNRTFGVTVVLSTHYMDEADHLCSRLAIIHRGRIAAQGSPEELKARVGRDTIRLVLRRPVPALVERLQAEPWVRQLSEEGAGQLQLSVEQGETRIARLLELVQDQGGWAERVSLQRPTLEDSFLHLTGSNLDEIDAASGAETLADRVRRRAWRS